MKRKSKILGGLLAIFLVVSVWGCGQTPEVKEETTTQEVAETEVETEVEAEAEAALPTPDESSSGVMFSGELLGGGTFTQDDLAGYDVTMVNVWGTFCPPCLNEMPSLQKMYEALPEKTNMILICGDAESEEATALEIIEELGMTMPNIKLNDQIFEVLLSDLEYYPTTIFLDQNGNRVGEVIIGAPSDEAEIITHYMTGLENAQKEALTGVKQKSLTEFSIDQE